MNKTELVIVVKQSLRYNYILTAVMLLFTLLSKNNYVFVAFTYISLLLILVHLIILSIAMIKK